ncbi:MAG TPA: DUF559 domain-containing protein [Acidimicrobiales bacterium]
MRRMFTTAEAASDGLTSSALRWGERRGRWRRVRQGVYAEGPEDPTDLDLARATVMASNAVASGALAGVLLGLDGVLLDARPTRRRSLPTDRIVVVDGLRCTDGLQTMVDLAALVDDLIWEQALESALRRRLVSIADLENVLPMLGRARVPGTVRIRRVLGLRVPGAPPTGSLLETLMLQLARTVPGLGEPVRQLRIGSMWLDLAWPDIGLFIELDGEQHLGQPVHDARRETAIVAATGWLCGRFTWTEVVRVPTATARRLGALADQARRRPFLPEAS